jgi:hypothetical protein
MAASTRTINIEKKKVLFFISPAVIRKALKDVIDIAKGASAKEYFKI